MGTSHHPILPINLSSRLQRCLAFLMLLLHISGSSAGDLVELQVTESDGTYRMKTVMLVDAPSNYVRDVLTDYAHIYRLNPSITQSHILPSRQQGVTRVETVMSVCAAFFCRDVKRVEDIRELEYGNLRAVIVPELSNLKSGMAEWNIQPEGKRTRVVYQGSMQPGFFIPPLIGVFLVKQNIRNELLTSFNRIECNARIRQQLDRSEHLQLATSSPEADCAEHSEDENMDFL